MTREKNQHPAPAVLPVFLAHRPTSLAPAILSFVTGPQRKSVAEAKVGKPYPGYRQ
jgi:hypothetical protein